MSASTPRALRSLRSRASVGMGVAALLAACTTEPPAPVPAARLPAGESARPAAPPPAALTGAVSSARNVHDYRRDAATHLYAKNSARIYGGKMPPLLYAIGVLETDINSRGAVTAVRWMRAPSHAPEVMAEIERAVRQAAPFPAPVKLGRVTYTDTWLWDKSGRFQLHTLTEGQL